MKYAEMIFRFIGCLLVCWVFSVGVAALFESLFSIPQMGVGSIIGGVTVGGMDLYYNKRKIKNFVQSC